MRYPASQRFSNAYRPAVNFAEVLKSNPKQSEIAASCDPVLEVEPNPDPTARSWSADDDGQANHRRYIMNLPSSDEMKGRWKQQIGAAKIAWGNLTEDELLKVEGHEQKLAGLIQERYAITRDEAMAQVKAFFEKNKP